MSEHCVVFVDKEHARVFHLDGARLTAALEARREKPESRRTRNFMDGKAEHPDPHFFADICAKLDSAKEILVVGHGTAHQQFAHFVEQKFPALRERIVSVENVDNPTDRQLVALAKRRFKTIDLWR